MHKFFPLYNTETPAVAALPERETIAEAHKWQLSDIFDTDEKWQITFGEIENRMKTIPEFQGKLGESAERLYECLQSKDLLEEQLYKLYLYAGLKNDQDTRVAEYQAFRDRVSSLVVQFNQAIAFIQPEILSLAETTMRGFIDAHEGLANYRHLLENILRGKAHVLPPAEERLLAMTGEIAQGPYNTFSMFNNADIKFPSIKDEDGNMVELTKGRYARFMESPNRQVRQDAFEGMYQTYGKWTNTLAATLSGAVKRDIFYARARKYPSALAAALDNDNIPVSVYENVVGSINRNIKPLHRYMTLRKRMLGVDELQPWDLSVPLLSDVKFEIPYAEALKTIETALAPLGDTYLADLKRSFNDGWIDVYENQGKRSGAYSWSTYGVHPFILLNYNNTLNDMFTTAHELGHALHSHLTHRHQPYHYSHYTIFVAEVASTLNEALLMDHLLKTCEDRKQKMYLLNEYIDQIRGTVFIQALFAEFEKTIHDKAESGEALTADAMSALTKDFYERYFGPAFNMHPEYQINWCRIPHFYYNFYVYQYATGFSAATALSRNILDGDTNARDAYLRFLSRGNSAYSIDLLKDAGVDMTSPAPIEATAQLMDRLLDELEELMG